MPAPHKEKKKERKTKKPSKRCVVTRKRFYGNHRPKLIRTNVVRLLCLEGNGPKP